MFTANIYLRKHNIVKRASFGREALRVCLLSLLKGACKVLCRAGFRQPAGGVQEGDFGSSEVSRVRATNGRGTEEFWVLKLRRRRNKKGSVADKGFH